MKVLEIWTDGSCWPNPGNGAWAFVLACNGEVITEQSAMEENVTNNRMEYLGLIKAFQYINANGISAQYDRIKVFSDSQLLVNTINSWMDKWKAWGWRRKQNRSWKPVANLDLVKELDLWRTNYVFTIEWVKGHANIPLNERCDQLCRLQFKKKGLKSFEELRETGKLFAKGGTNGNEQRSR